MTTPPERHGFAEPPLLPSQNPWLDLDVVGCAQCGTVVAYANAKSPTRTLKVVCSPSCGSDYFRTPYIRVKEP